MKLGPLPDACQTHWNGFHCVRTRHWIRGFTTHWIPGFMTFRLAQRTWTVMLMVSAWPESGFGGTSRPAPAR